MLYDKLNVATAPVADTLRGTIAFMDPDCAIDHLLTSETARPVADFSHSDAKPRALILASNHCRVRSSAKESKRGK